VAAFSSTYTAADSGRIIPGQLPARTEVDEVELREHHLKRHQRNDDPGTVTRHVSEHVQLLYNASTLLKRSGVTGRYLRTNASTTGRDDTIDEFFPFDRGHVQEKLLQWYDDWAAQNLKDYRGRADSDVTGIRAHDALVLRLAKANIRRRIQLQYWLRHADTPDDMPPGFPIIPGIQDQPNKAATTSSKFVNSEMQEAPTASSVAARTTNTKVSFSTAVMSELKDTQNEDVAHTEYEESIMGKFKSTRVPALPGSAYKFPEFKCPYCGLSLKSSLMRSRRTWKYALPTHAEYSYR
jgi:hypothetical protein